MNETVKSKKLIKQPQKMQKISCGFFCLYPKIAQSLL